MGVLEDLAAELGMSPASLAAAIQGGAQSEALFPNYLTINAQGQVGALFTGGVQLNEDTVPPGPARPINPFNESITWIRSAGGYAAQVFALKATSGTHADSLILTAIQDSTPNPAQILVETFDSNGNIQSAATLLDSAHNSSFLQLLSTQKLHVQAGTLSVNLVAGDNDIQFALPTAWPATHVSCYADIGISTNMAALTKRGSGAWTLSQGRLVVNNSSGVTINGATLTFISFGS